jgi:gliding motility-associated-like protein
MKNRVLLSLFIIGLSLTASAQMRVKQPNFTSFRADKKEVTETLIKQSSAAAQKHPEYGIIPYNAQCSDCIELVEDRTIDSRQFTDKNNERHTYSQKSYFPLHYKKSETDVWHTIDQRLRPTSDKNVFIAKDQPAATKCDLNAKSTSINVGDFDFEFNKNLSLFFFDDNTVYTQTEKGNYNTYTIGEEGLNVKNIWAGIDMEQIFTAGEIKTNFVINAPLQLPISKGYMVIEDHFTLPQGYTFEESPQGSRIEGKYYQGNYFLRNSKGETILTYEKPIFVDAKAYGMHGSYKLLRTGNDYTLQTLVPIDWLNKKDNNYPIYIDPIVSAASKIGNFTSAGSSASMGFTTTALGACEYYMLASNLTSVNVPGKSQLTNAYVDVEYSLTFDNTCGSPPLPSPYCTFSMASMEVRSDDCGTTTGPLTCNPAQPPFTGTCTTDSNLVPGASALLINSFVPNYLTCIPPQCSDYRLEFTLLNRDAMCGDVCGYLCARGNFWRMTVAACQVEGDITQDKTQVCAGEPVTFTANPTCGVPPYSFKWTQDAGNTFDSVFNITTFTVNPQSDINMGCTITDACGKTWQTNDLSVTVIPSPPADAGSTLPVCEGGSVQLGGSPTTNAGNAILWTGENATVQGWLSNNQTPNPVVTIPAGTVDTFYYVVRVTNSSCFRTDTVYVSSLANPVAVIDTNGATNICANQNVNIAVVGNFASYTWSNGSTASSINVNQAGAYQLTVADANNCTAVSNTITVSSIALPTVNVFPDTLIVFGDSVMLYTDFNLNSSVVDSFMWSPNANISCTYCANPYVSPTNDQYYSVVVHAGGCTVSDSALVRVILPNNFFIPNAFTPNGDGNNDNFYIQSQGGVKVVLFQVFNRIGEKVHEGSYPWDGTYKNKPAPAGVYVYIFKIGLYGDSYALFRKGSVTMIR